VAAQDAIRVSVPAASLTGLALVRQLAGGRIEFRPAAARGTDAVVCLPAV